MNQIEIDKNYRLKRKIECQKLFSGFHPDLSRCKEPKVVLKCLELASQGYYSREIAPLGGKSEKAVQKIYRRYNFPCLYNFFPPRLEERINWKGGQWTDKTGHIWQKVKNHPYAQKDGRVAYHRLIVEEHLGRYLLPQEVVHHIDGNPANNDISNLRVYSSNAEHLHDTLKGHCPKWTLEGKSKILEVCRKNSRNRLKSNYDTQPIPFE